MRRRIFNLLSLLSLTVCIALAAGWVFSRAQGSCGTARYTRPAGMNPADTSHSSGNATERADALTINNGRVVWETALVGGLPMIPSKPRWVLTGITMPQEWDYGVHRHNPYMSWFGSGQEDAFYGCSLGRSSEVLLGTMPIAARRIAFPCSPGVVIFALLPLLWFHRSGKKRKGLDNGSA
jgi:hypothetical protein